MKECSGYDTKLHLVVGLQFWRSGECRIPLHSHYSQVHSGLRVVVPVSVSFMSEIYV